MYTILSKKQFNKQKNQNTPFEIPVGGKSPNQKRLRRQNQTTDGFIFRWLYVQEMRMARLLTSYYYIKTSSNFETWLKIRSYNRRIFHFQSSKL